MVEEMPEQTFESRMALTADLLLLYNFSRNLKIVRSDHFKKQRPAPKEVGLC
jgi:hypothetical protein